MKRLLSVASVVVGLAACVQQLGAQVFMEESNAGALRQLRNVAIVIRGSATSPTNDVVSPTELGNRTTVGLHRAVSALRLDSLGTPGVPYLIVSAVASPQGSSVSLTLHRWARLTATGGTVFAAVWEDARFGFGSTTKNNVLEMLDTLIDSFAANYIRANP